MYFLYLIFYIDTQLIIPEHNALYFILQIRFARLVDEDRRVSQMAGKHKDPDFKWEYLDYLYDD